MISLKRGIETKRILVEPIWLHEGHSLSIYSAVLGLDIRIEFALILMKGLAKGSEFISVFIVLVRVYY
jgi:hypothetical protein